MRIGLYGLPTAGKSFVLARVKNLEVLAGSRLLKELAPNFHDLSASEQACIRKRLAANLKDKPHFIMDGHYAFGDKTVFTEADGALYDAFLYLYIKPEILKARMRASEKNKSYLAYNLAKWQDFEVEALRAYCHKHDKDFYVLDNPEDGCFSDVDAVLAFIALVAGGFSCVKTAEQIAKALPAAADISLLDGDKTFMLEDSCAGLGYRTHVFDGNFYTGFQTWQHHQDLSAYLQRLDPTVCQAAALRLTPNDRVLPLLAGNAAILTSGLGKVWEQIGKRYGISVFSGAAMCADTKYFVTKFLQKRGARVTAFGDSMNDYYMLRQADVGYLVLKKDGSVSTSLKRSDLEGLNFV